MRQYVGTREQGGKLRNEVEIMSGKGYSITTSWTFGVIISVAFYKSIVMAIHSYTGGLQVQTK